MTERVKKADMPTLEQLQKEVDRVHYRRDFSRVMINTIYSLVVVAAIAVLVAVLLLPILRIYGHSMNDTLDEGDIVVSLKGSDFKTGDIIAFYYNNKILIKRVIGKAGDWVDIDQDGNVYVNGNLVDEPYLDDKAFGECNIELPYQVPESKVFVMGDMAPQRLREIKIVSKGAGDFEEVKSSLKVYKEQDRLQGTLGS